MGEGGVLGRSFVRFLYVFEDFLWVMNTSGPRASLADGAVRAAGEESSV